LAKAISFSELRRGAQMKKKRYLFLVGLILLIGMLGAACNSAVPKAKTGDTVKVQYTGKLQDGTVFDTSEGNEPLEFTLGQGQLIPGFEKAVLGMKIGESKTVAIPVDQAYGPRRNELVQVVSRDKLSADLKPEVGMQLQTMQSNGATAVVTITEVTDTTVTIDANSPLAGKDLTFEIKLMGIGTSNSQPGATGSAEGAKLASIKLEQALLNGKPTLAEFGRGTCIPCKEMKPILEELAVQYKDRLNVAIVSVDDYSQLTSYYKVMAIPTQIGFDNNGKEVFRHVGAWPKDQIISQLSKLGVK
jgi:peptidylprolyl isomerase